MAREWAFARWVDPTLVVEDGRSLDEEAREAAERAALMLTLLRAGRELEGSMLSTKLGMRLRHAYGDLWRTWIRIDRELKLGWGLDAVSTEPDAGSRRRAATFDLEKWWLDEGSKLPDRFVMAVSRVGSIDHFRRAERSKVNRLLNCLKSESERIVWSVQKEE